MAKQAAARGAKRSGPAREPDEVLPAEVQGDVQLMRSAADELDEFMRGVVAFFQGAHELEVKAKATLDLARGMPAPKTAEEDARVQRGILEATADRKAGIEYWKITGLFHDMHKKLVAERDRPANMLKEAGEILQQHHNRFVDERRREAARIAEQERLERERVAREEQQREAERLEREALEREASAPALSSREREFVDLVVKGIAEGTAAQRAGYKVGQVAALLGRAKVAQAIADGRAAKVLREQAQAVATQPVRVEASPVKVDVQKVGSDREIWSGEILDAAKLRDAVIDGGYGIPRDVLGPIQTKVNEYARSLREQLDRWPGCRAKKQTRTV